MTESTPTVQQSSQGVGQKLSRVAVVLVYYNDYANKYLPECYASLSIQSYPAEYCRIFVVNNGGTEESERFATRIAPTARLLRNASNLGWTGGNNTAIRAALEEGFDYVVMLNIDSVVDRDWLAYLVKAADDHHDVHIFQSRIMLQGTDQINSIGNKIHYLGYGYCHGYGEKATPQGKDSLHIDFASGASMLVKRKVFEHIGFFRGDYFMYYDDLEFCWRARLAGYNIGLAERSIAYHRYAFRRDPHLLYCMGRNRLVTLLTLEKLRTLLVILPCLLVAEFVMGLYFVLTGLPEIPKKLCQYFLTRTTWERIAWRRQEVQRLRVRKDAQIVKRFAGTVGFTGVIEMPIVRYVINPILWVYWVIARTLIIW